MDENNQKLDDNNSGAEPEPDAKLIQEIERLKANLIEREKLAFIGQLSAGILHEIKNPLNFVSSFSKISIDLIDELKETIENIKDDIGEDIKNDLDDITFNLNGNINKILENSNRTQRIIMSMLAQSREGNSVQFVETDINQLIDEFTKLAYQGIRGQNKEFNVSIKTNYDANLQRVNVAAAEMSRVILNIVNNACYALNQKKKQLADAYNPELLITTKKLEKDFAIHIKDNGMGIPQNIIEKIFNPFFTTKPSGEGTGLGLYMSYDIISKIHKGKFEVKSVPEEFTEFIITIPLI